MSLVLRPFYMVVCIKGLRQSLARFLDHFVQAPTREGLFRLEGCCHFDQIVCHFNGNVRYFERNGKSILRLRGRISPAGRDDNTFFVPWHFGFDIAELDRDDRCQGIITSTDTKTFGSINC
uniref:Uncharacterized protein n=1 Tax=Candidatus Kentrum sp. MB TaxID=2138164 RepID=A0A450XQW1_9GAMM|nr:MAG: hypothetical protein BECKMB1821I_GA0114274_10264 [Candidatus Kentron sp. MB]